MSSILGAIITSYQNNVSTEMQKLTTDLGSNKMWSDSIPSNKTMPYVILNEDSNKIMGANVAQTRIIYTHVSFNIYASTRPTVELVADDLEGAYITTPPILLTGISLLGVWYIDRIIKYDKPQQVWTGKLILNFKNVRCDS